MKDMLSPPMSKHGGDVSPPSPQGFTPLGGSVQGRQTRQNSGGVGEVTQDSGPFFKGSTF